VNSRKIAIPSLAMVYGSTIAAIPGHIIAEMSVRTKHASAGLISSRRTSEVQEVKTGMVTNVAASLIPAPWLLLRISDKHMPVAWRYSPTRRPVPYRSDAAVLSPLRFEIGELLEMSPAAVTPDAITASIIVRKS
jgi:hypothetical protein